MTGSSQRDYSRLEPTLFARERVAGTTALVVGAGALGNEVIKNLALLGIGHLIIVDRDRIDASNLTRSVLFCTPDAAMTIARGAWKADVAAARVREINPDVAVAAMVCEVADVGLGVARRADVVFGCLDNEMARLELGWICQRLDKPFVDGGLGNVNTSSGAVAVYPGANGPCYACRKGTERRRRLLWEMQGREDPCWLKERAAPGMVATTPIMASIVGAVQIELGLRQVFATPTDTALGSFVKLQLAPAVSVEQRGFERSPQCPLHEDASRIDVVIEREDRRSDRWTVRDLLDESGAPQGVLALDWPLTVRARCEGCAHDWEPLVRRTRFRGSACPRCGSLEIVEREVVVDIAGSSPWATRPLAALGLPSGHVHELVVDMASGRRVHVEVTGDLVQLRAGAHAC